MGGFPAGGSCETEDGSVNLDFVHEIPLTMIAPKQVISRGRAAEALCASCPVLEACREWAGRSQWQSVTVAGWTAPGARPAYPPWAVFRCDSCNNEIPSNRRDRADDYLQANGFLCAECKERRRKRAHYRWWAYVDPSKIDDSGDDRISNMAA